jgi:hypothetical protein
MDKSSSEWSQRGIAGGFRERLAGSPAGKLGPLFIALAVVVTARVGASNDFATAGIFRDSGRWVTLPVMHQAPALLLEGTPRCEEMIRVDTASHSVMAKGMNLRNTTSSPLHIAVVFREWSAAAERKSVEFETLDPGANEHSLLLQAPLQPGAPNVPEPQPIAPGVTRCDLAVWVVPEINSGPTINPTRQCAGAIAQVQANQLALSTDASMDDSIRRCGSPEDWEAAWLAQVGDLGFPPIQLPQPLDDLLASMCFDPDRALEETSVCRILIARSNQRAASAAS